MVTAKTQDENHSQISTADVDKSNLASRSLGLDRYQVTRVCQHDARVQCVAFSQEDSKLFISCGHDGRALIWTRQSCRM
ncbi:MAG: Methylosome protein 50, partial [Paramarteilia canceri]